MFLTDTTLTPRDPHWVGAWWLGYLICAFFAVVWAVPLIMFPPVMKEEAQVDKEEPRSPIDTLRG